MLNAFLSINVDPVSLGYVGPNFEQKLTLFTTPGLVLLKVRLKNFSSAFEGHPALSAFDLSQVGTLLRQSLS